MVRSISSGHSKNLCSRIKMLLKIHSRLRKKERPSCIKTHLKCLSYTSTLTTLSSKLNQRSTRLCLNLCKPKICSRWRIFSRLPLSMSNWINFRCYLPNSNFIWCNKTWECKWNLKKKLSRIQQIKFPTNQSPLSLKTFEERVRPLMNLRYLIRNLPKILVRAYHPLIWTQSSNS